MSILYTKARPYGGRIPPSWWSGNNNWYNNLADELTPNLPIIDVVNDFPWTLTPTRTEARNEAPYIFLREFLQLETQLNQSILPYSKPRIGTNPVPIFPEQDIPLDGSSFTFIEELATSIETNTNKIYEGLFDHLTPTNFIYKLPFFTGQTFNIKNNWEATDILDKIIQVQTEIGSIGRAGTIALFGDKGSSMAGFLQSLPRIYKQLEIFNLQAGNPTVGLMDPPHVWKGASNRSYTFQFPLYNINTSNSTDFENLILKNWEFCFLLTYQNLINKRNFYTGIPPVFYEVSIPGVHYCKASYISDITINNLGNIRLLTLPINGNRCDVNVPDAYSIQITLTDLLQPSKNLFESVVNTTTRTKIQKGQI